MTAKTLAAVPSGAVKIAKAAAAAGWTTEVSTCGDDSFRFYVLNGTNGTGEEFQASWVGTGSRWRIDGSPTVRVEGSDWIGAKLAEVAAVIEHNPAPVAEEVAPVAPVAPVAEEPAEAAEVEWLFAWRADEDDAGCPIVYRNALCDGVYYGIGRHTTVPSRLRVHHIDSRALLATVDTEAEAVAVISGHRAELEIERAKEAAAKAEALRERVRSYGFTAADMEALASAYTGRLDRDHPSFASLVARGWLVPWIVGGYVYTFGPDTELAWRQADRGIQAGWLTTPEQRDQAPVWRCVECDIYRTGADEVCITCGDGPAEVVERPELEEPATWQCGGCRAHSGMGEAECTVCGFGPLDSAEQDAHAYDEEAEAEEPAPVAAVPSPLAAAQAAHLYTIKRTGHGRWHLTVSGELYEITRLTGRASYAVEHATGTGRARVGEPVGSLTSAAQQAKQHVRSLALAA
ncbi:hypothetical protein OG618_37860 (plasmid) [Kitasatospora sp. NBC_01246]|uniref:hypothetical protein n=1 Tax=Kitasatospora sp. NBC_01246 TaxID=2903570 RepID=UPI002E363DC5|nr:hypothetical protein [Kitasatospora sp. NBC_01246]